MSLFVIRPLNAAGQVTAHPMHSIVRDDWSYVYLLSGEVLIDIDKRPYLLKASDFALIPPSVHYSVKYFKDTIGYMGAFSPDLLRNAGHSVLRMKEPSVLSIPVEDKLFYDELMIRLMRHAGQAAIVRSLIEVILSQFDELIPVSDESAASRLCSSYLEKVFDVSLPFTNVAGYASLLGVTPSHLNRTVKAETGKSAGEWIDNARLALARELLCDNSMPMSEIAERLCFSEASYFSRFFRKMTGISPSAFREKMV